MKDQQAPITRERVTGPFKLSLVKKKGSVRRLGKLKQFFKLHTKGFG